MKNIVSIFLILVLVVIGCTDLDVDVYSDITEDNFFKTEKQVLSVAGPPYTALKCFAIVEGVWGLNNLTTDELLIPTRGPDWYNDGIYQRFHRHEWLTTDFIIDEGWKRIYDGISRCNLTIYQYSQIEDQSEALLSVSNELEGVRAFYYFLAMDLFGNVPLVLRYDVEEGYAPSVTPRADIFDYIENALAEGVGVLNPVIDIETYGRFHRYAAYTLMAKLYLNAEVYIGTPMYEECVVACDSVINSDNFIIEDDYFSNFAVHNESSQENIFVVPFDNVGAVDWDKKYMFCLHLWTLHGSNRLTYNTQQSPWNGICGVPSFYHSYDSTDIRRDAWLVGQQYSSTGDTLFASKGLAGKPLNFTIDFSAIETATENDGVRIAKYDYTGAQNYQMENDYVVFRYADVLLMKAEALMRLNGGTATQEAVDLVNQVRVRAFPDDPGKLYTTGTLTLDALLAERGWELCTEGWRRNDLIRFGKYNDPLDFRPNAAAEYHNLFPIPQNQINANPNLTQNPGY